MSKYITISDARANLPGLVEKVNSGSDEVIITVYGKPLAKLVPAASSKKKKGDTDTEAWNKLSKYAGIWDNEDGKLIAKYAAQMRRKGKILRTK